MDRYAEKRMRFGLRLLLLLLAGAIFFSRDGWTDTCHIRIINKTHLGETQRLVFKTRLASKQECRKLAQLHAPNFEPQRVAHKDVAFKWQSGLSRR